MSRVPLPPALLSVPLTHRGYHDVAARRPENSLSAFEAAAQAGYAIELDVELTRDGQAMVFHDDTLDRMTAETGPLQDRTAAELGRITLNHSDDRIPTLAQVLDRVAGRVPLLIEIKDRWDTMGVTSGLLEKATAEALSGYSGDVAVMSFNPNCMAEFTRLAPHLPRGLTTDYYDPADNEMLPPEVCARLREIPDFERTASSFISHKHSDLWQPRVAELKAQGAAILCWTVRSPEQEALARKVAHNITFEGYPAPFPA